MYPVFGRVLKCGYCGGGGGVPEVDERREGCEWERWVGGCVAIGSPSMISLIRNAAIEDRV